MSTPNRDEPTAEVTVRWHDQPTAVDLTDVVPTRITSAGGQVFLAPGESVRLPAGLVVVRAEVPDHEVLESMFLIPSVRRVTLILSRDALKPRHALLNASHLPFPVAIDVGSRSVSRIGARASVDISLMRSPDGFAVTRLDGSPIPLEFAVATRFTPRRLLAVPPVGQADEYRVLWQGEGASVVRPMIEPTDVGGRVLVDYLRSGRYDLAAAAARGVERRRGAANPLDWAAASYTQLLIGYAYALGEDRENLLVWCRRTAAERSLGADGIVLAARAAWLNSQPESARGKLSQAADLPPPVVALGAEMGIQLAMFIGANRDVDRSGLALDGPGTELLRMTNRWLQALSIADPQAVNFSVPETQQHSPDLSTAPWPRRLRWLLRYTLSRWRYDHILRDASEKRVRQTIKEVSMSASTIIPVASHVIEPASFYRRWWLILLAAAIAVWLALSVSLIINDTFSSTAWLVLGSVQAIAFSFAGVLFGIDVQRERDGGAERRAAAAEKMAIDFRDDAMRGRALAAVLQAEDVSAETLSQETVAVLKRNRYLAINLFGELVRNGQKGPAAEAESIPIGPLTP